MTKLKKFLPKAYVGEEVNSKPIKGGIDETSIAPIDNTTSSINTDWTKQQLFPGFDYGNLDPNETSSDASKLGSSLYDYHKKHRKDPNSALYIAQYEKEHPDVVKPKYLFGKFGKFMSKLEEPAASMSETADKALAFGNILATAKTNKEEDLAAKSRFRQASFDRPVTPASMSGNMGDYVTNTGGFRPNEKVVNKGMYTNNFPGFPTFAEGGVIEQPITEAPLNLISEQKAASVESNATPSEMTSSSEDYILPVSNFKITSGYGNRKAPKAGASTNHNGLDLAVPLNSDVFSPMDGVVSSITTDGKGGNQLIIEHSNGYKTGYAHLNGFKVRVGDHVNKGQLVAFSGNTGNTTGPHLHFTLRDASGDLIDPSTYFNFDRNKPSSSSNNPLNVHYGDFTKGYGASKGIPDSGGYVANFSDLETGIKANKDLLFGPAYNTLSISQARNKWVSGDPTAFNNSTEDIVKSMGGDKLISQLSSKEKDKLFKLFAKWEGKDGYNMVKNKTIFKEGGEMRSFDEGDEVELTEEQIKEIIANGGNVEYL
jgi:murein DD-endopeptidase MepM/ murein hydrolase activator NlpD